MYVYAYRRIDAYIQFQTDAEVTHMKCYAVTCTHAYTYIHANDFSARNLLLVVV
jgi:hypothetical protein